MLRFKYSSISVLRERVPLATLSRGLATLAQDVKSDATFRIPVVDLTKFRTSHSKADQRYTADEVVTAFKEVGFVYLSGHGIPEATVKNVFSKSADFFRMPVETKAQLAWYDPRANRGYVQPGRERVTQSTDAKEIAALREKAPDCKETMEIGRDWDPVWRNMWPEEKDCPGFKQTMLEFYETCHKLHNTVMRTIALGLDLEESFFDDKINEKCHNLRLLSYPPIRTEILRKEGQARAGAHSDYGTLTLLFQDSVGGLEVQNPHTKHYQPATPIPGTIVVNVGDLMSRWSNDILRSTLHRVVAPPAQRISETEQMTPARQSVAFFCNPNAETVVDCLPSCFGQGVGREKKYAAIGSEEYLVQRLSQTYTY